MRDRIISDIFPIIAQCFVESALNTKDEYTKNVLYIKLGNCASEHINSTV